MTVFEEKYQKLNAAQREAVDTIEGPVMVIAGPGTGKTTLVTLRIANILLRTDTPASGILAITFTESGVRSLKQKLFELIGDKAYEVRIHTFHSFAASVIAEFNDHFIHIHDFDQISEVQAESLIRTLLTDSSFSLLRPFGDPDYYINSILRTISESKREALSPEMVESFAREQIEKVRNDEESISTRGKSKGELKATALKEIEKLEKTILFAGAYRKYEEEKKKRKLLDYDDLIFELLLALGRDELLKKLLQEKFLYLHIDEHQDTNDAQNLIMKLLSDFFESPNICIVGDEKQAVYRFQGASVENFLTFKKAWKEMKIIKLESNYRSHQSILDASFAMIERNYADDEHQDLRTRLLSESGSKAVPVEVVTLSTEAQAKTYLVEIVRRILKESKDEVAIITRNNKEVDSLLTLLEENDIEVSAERSADIFKHPISQLFFSLIRFISEREDAGALGNTIALGLWNLNFEDKVAMIQSLRKEGVAQVSARIPVLAIIDEELLLDSPLLFIRRLAELSGFIAIVSRDALSLQVWQALLSLFEQVIKERDIESPREALSALLEHWATGKAPRVNMAVGRKDCRVSIMTAHRSKGLEFDQVIIPYGIEEAWSLKKKANAFVLPHRAELSEDDSLRDARRLFYVALTRGKKHVTIMVPEEGIDRSFTELRFIAELDPAHVQRSRAESMDESVLLTAHLVPLDKRLLDLASRMIHEKGLSVTALNHFLECPSKFIIKSVLKVPEMPNAVSEKGNAMHYAMAEVAELPEKSLSAIAHCIEESVRYYFTTSILYSFEKKALEKELLSMASKIAQSLTPHFNQKGEMKTEKWFETQYGIPLHGKLDLVVEDEGVKRVYDYKTRAKMSEAEIRGETKASDGSYFRQLVFYVLLLQGRESPSSARCIPSLIFLIPDKSGICHIESLAIIEADIVKLKSEIDSLVTAVDSGELLTMGCRQSDCAFCAMRKLL